MYKDFPNQMILITGILIQLLNQYFLRLREYKKNLKDGNYSGIADDSDQTYEGRTL